MEKVAWVIPSFIEGSGGYRTIFQHVNEMAKSYECHIYVYDSGDYKNDEAVAKAAEKFYGKCNCKFILGYDISTEVDYVMIFATSWLTAETVYLYKGKAEKVYFVQDYEPMFYPAGDEYLRAAGTYELGFYHITIGRWLAKKLQDTHGAKAAYYDFGVNEKIYNSVKGVERENSICFIFQPDKPRRATQLGIDALEIVKTCYPDIKIYLYGSKAKIQVPFQCTFLGIIRPEECAELYRKSVVGLCISASNPSRVPFEMMACGLPVVDVYTENNLYDYTDNIVLAQSSPEALAQAIIDLIKNPDMCKKIKYNANEFIKKRHIAEENKKFMDIVYSIKLGETNNYFENKIYRSYRLKMVNASYEITELRRKISLMKKKTIIEKLEHNSIIRRIPGIKNLRNWLR